MSKRILVNMPTLPSLRTCSFLISEETAKRYGLEPSDTVPKRLVDYVYIETITETFQLESQNSQEKEEAK